MEDAFEACRISDDAVLSFHHHLRNGDAVMCDALDVAARRGLRGLGPAASSIFPVHSRLVEHIRADVVTRLWTGYMNGPVADAVSRGALQSVARLQSHGSRARALALGEIEIDATFIAAPAADASGNLAGAVGEAACWTLGYAEVDAEHARRVIAIVQEVHDTPLPRCEIEAASVDFAVRADWIGDPAGIASGTTRIATDPVSLKIADCAAAVVAAAGNIRDDLSLQTERGPDTVARIAKARAVYLIAVGGAAVLVSRAIRGARLVAFEDLGMEAVREFDVVDMPVTVAVDLTGQSVHERGPAQWRRSGEVFGTQHGDA